MGQKGVTFSKNVCIMCQKTFDDDLELHDGSMFFCTDCAKNLNAYIVNVCKGHPIFQQTKLTSDECRMELVKLADEFHSLLKQVDEVLRKYGIRGV